MANLTVLFLGDIYGKSGREAIRTYLPRLVEAHGVDLVLANAENSAGGIGVMPKELDDLQEMGIHGFTSGNHIFSKKEILPALEANLYPIVRPANYPESVPGRSYLVLEQRNHDPVLLINLLGRVLMKDLVDCPFQCMDRLLGQFDRDMFSAVVVDFHAETTSEKIAMAHALDGRVSVLVGTHTHVPTADARIFPKGLGYVTDVGMTGPYRDTVIGADKDNVLYYYRTGTKLKRWEIGKGPAAINAVLFRIDTTSKKTTHVERVDVYE